MPSPTTRHGEFWLYDGSIVLAVENTLFRVHQTILANHSEVFADLFTIPQPDGEEMIDGCHVVRLFDDNENHFTDLLRAMYHPEYVLTLVIFSYYFSESSLVTLIISHQMLTLIR